MQAKNRNKTADSKQRVLKAACRLFSERGFRGTYIREVCQCAKVNIATVCYHFHGKDKLYEAVAQEACRRLLLAPERLAFLTSDMTPELRLYATIQSLFQRLSGDAEWIAKFAAREWVEPVEVKPGPVEVGLREDLELLEAAIRGVIGADVALEVVRLTALSVLSQCVFYCAAWPLLPRMFPGFDSTMLSLESLTKHVTDFALGASARNLHGRELLVEKMPVFWQPKVNSGGIQRRVMGRSVSSS